MLKVPISGQVSGQSEADNVALVAMSGHYGGGIWTTEFEKRFGAYMGARHAIMCNSGSSANLLALSAIELPPKSRILTSAVNFPTTVNAIIQRGFTPVFVDADPKTLNAVDVDIDLSEIRAIVMAHTLGNPMDLTHYASYRIPIIEDACDAIGSTINGRMVGRVGIMSTASFYPAHHITTGEGGAVFSNNAGLISIAESIRDWGRDCWCEPGKENTCGKRFEQNFEPLPYGYDHKYTYTRLGFNLKITEVSAACGLEQSKRLPEFIRKRKANFSYLAGRLESLSSKIILPVATEGTEPSWFGFPITLKKEGERASLQEYLDSHKIGSRLLFSGNITKQPYMKGRNFRISGSLENSDKIMNDSLWLGVHPHLTEEMLEFVASKLEAFFA